MQRAATGSSEVLFRMGWGKRGQPLSRDAAPKLFLPGVLYNPRLADHGDFNFTRILEFLFYLGGDVAGHELGFGVGNFLRGDKDADFAPSLQSRSTVLDRVPHRIE